MYVPGHSGRRGFPLGAASVDSPPRRGHASGCWAGGCEDAALQDSYFTSVKVAGFFTVLLQLDVAVAQSSVYITTRSNVSELLKPVTDVVEAVLRA